jgi:hypothetical protein
MPKSKRKKRSSTSSSSSQRSSSSRFNSTNHNNKRKKYQLRVCKQAGFSQSYYQMSGQSLGDVRTHFLDYKCVPEKAPVGYTPIQQPLQSRNTVGYRGVSKMGKKFKAQIRIGSNHTHIGMYDTAKEAAVAYDRAVLKASQDLLNFPDLVHNLDVEPKRKSNQRSSSSRFNSTNHNNKRQKYQLRVCKQAGFSQSYYQMSGQSLGDVRTQFLDYKCVHNIVQQDEEIEEQLRQQQQQQQQQQDEDEDEDEDNSSTSSSSSQRSSSSKRQKYQLRVCKQAGFSQSYYQMSGQSLGDVRTLFF